MFAVLFSTALTRVLPPRSPMEAMEFSSITTGVPGFRKLHPGYNVYCGIRGSYQHCPRIPHAPSGLRGLQRSGV